MNNKSGEPLKLVSVPAENNQSEAGELPKTGPVESSESGREPVLPTSHGEHSDQTRSNSKLLAGRYELLKVLGKGNISTVYKSIDKDKSAANWNHFVTIKILQRKFHENREWITFKSELTQYHHLEHPNITKTSSLNRLGATGFIIMEYLSGKSLGQTVRSLGQNRIASERTLEILNGIGRALTYAHEQGIVHGDLKPANVFLTDSGKVKVIDFGLTQTLRNTAKDKTESPHYGTNNFSASSSSYACPQLLDLGKAEPCDDVYSLACMTYEMLTGQHPFGRVRSSGAQEFGLKLKTSDAFTGAQWNSLQKALDFNREQRTATVEEFLAEFNTCGSGPSATAALRSARMRWVFAVAGVLAVVMIILFFFSRQNLTNPEEVNNRLPQTFETEVVDPELPFETAEEQLIVEERLPILTPVDSETPKLVLRQKIANEIAGSEQTDLPVTVEQNLSDEGPQIILPLPIPDQNPVDRQVADLMNLAENQISAKQLSSPVGDNALETYREIFRLAPEYVDAKQGIAKIKILYRNWSDIARNQGDWNKAKTFAQKSASIEPRNEQWLLETLGNIEVLSQIELQKSQLVEKSAVELVGDKIITAPKPEIALISSVKHELVPDQVSSVATIHAVISGAINQLQVFVDKGQGFKSQQLYDDGTHGDRVSADGEFSATVILSNYRRDTRYYLVATSQSGASISSPVDARNESYNIQLPLGTLQQAIVINEFMASNDQTIADSLGGYDDWIELYNRSGQAVDLSGYYLSDNPQETNKWRFPGGAEIAANSYLMVWADRSSSSTNMRSYPPEFHTNFMLSKRSGQILLVENGENGFVIIDQVSFGRQREDQSMARFPNGVGEFGSTATVPTPGQVNISPK